MAKSIAALLRLTEFRLAEICDWLNRSAKNRNYTQIFLEVRWAKVAALRGWCQGYSNKLYKTLRLSGFFRWPEPLAWGKTCLACKKTEI
jgi:hypothetical protein